MAAKTKPTTIDDYFAALSDDRRAALEKRAAGDAEGEGNL